MATLRTIGIVISWATVLGWMGLIFYFSQQPSVPQSAITLPILRLLPEWTLQWVYHGTVFAILGALVYVSVRLSFSLSWHIVAITAFVIAVGYGVTDEWHQSFVSGRSADVADIGRDAIGAFSAVVFAHLVTAVLHRIRLRKTWVNSQLRL